MSVFNLLKKICRDERGQNAVESLLLIVVLVVFIAAALHGLLPNLASGFMEMAKTIGGPVP